MKTFFFKLSAGIKNLFLSNGRLKYWLLMITLKPIFTYFLYPKDTTDLIRFNPDNIQNFTSEAILLRNFFAFHLEYIFTYELIAFVYSGILVLLLYLFVNSKTK